MYPAYEVCKRRIVALNGLPGIPEHFTDNERDIHMSSLVPFDSINMVSSEVSLSSPDLVFLFIPFSNLLCLLLVDAYNDISYKKKSLQAVKKKWIKSNIKNRDFVLLMLGCKENFNIFYTINDAYRSCMINDCKSKLPRRASLILFSGTKCWRFDQIHRQEEDWCWIRGSRCESSHLGT